VSSIPDRLPVMNSNDHATGTIALVTGASSGVGFETAYQLAATGYAKVILGCRTLEKAAAARERLLARGAADVFDVLEIDVSEVQSSRRASDELLRQGHALSLLILNAGTAGGSTVIRNSAGIDVTFASTLIGHHTLTLGLLNGGGITDHGRIIIAGSEAARGDVLGMTQRGSSVAPGRHGALRSLSDM
jgi:NAD(P)-dependent dehydrogenase (short-subunit alcohol dehydrogenase family)